VTRKGNTQKAFDAVLCTQPEDMLQLLAVIPPQLHASQLLPTLAQAASLSKDNLAWCGGCV